MRKIFANGLATLAAILVLASGTSGRAQEAGVRLTQSDGTVQIQTGGAGDWKAAREGDVLGRGDRLATRDRSGALLFWSNGSMVKLYPDTEIVITDVSLDIETKMEKSLIDLDKGRLFVKAQVPENLFADFKVRAGNRIYVRSQGAEFAVKYDQAAQSMTTWSLLGSLLVDVSSTRVRVDEGRQGVAGMDAKAGVAPMDDKIREALAKVSKDLGGSLLVEELAPAPGGKLVAKIGGVKARRGNTPFTVRFKAMTAGGKVKSVTWDFGDGETASTPEAEHTFTQGVYAIVLRVEDDKGNKASAQTSISVEADCGC